MQTGEDLGEGNEREGDGNVKREIKLLMFDAYKWIHEGALGHIYTCRVRR